MDPQNMRVVDLKQELVNKHGIENNKIAKLLKNELIKMVKEKRAD